ncbi:major capsid protein [Brevibacillus laterosporus]|uniref:major capsid protein n=1 Tax=Brevibacillus laterosporus TaxID=1465 RepID=UPI003D1D4188
MNLNLYKTTTLLEATTRMFPLRTFLRDTFFPSFQTFVTEEVLIDYKRGRRTKMAPFVANRVGGITIDRDGYKTEKYTAPKIAPQRIITIDDLVLRGKGENLFSQSSPADRQAKLIGTDLSELDVLITQREEWMIRELLFMGKIKMKGFIDVANSKTIDQVLDYQFENRETLVKEAKWDQTTSKKYEDLERWRDIVIQKSGKAPTMVVFGKTAWENFRKDEAIMKMLDIRNATFGQINPIIRDDALTYLGHLTELGLDLYRYNDWYVDDDNVEQPIIPSDQVLLARPNLGEFLYGAVTQMEQGQFYTYEGKRIPKSWSDDQNEQRMIRISSRPVPRPENIDYWFVAKVV